MKIAGIELEEKPKPVLIPIFRGDEEVMFQADCLINLTELEQILPAPKPKNKFIRGNSTPIPMIDDPAYLEQINEYTNNRINYIVAKSLLATEGLTWEKVDFANPETWEAYRDELKAANFTEFQIMQLVKGVMDANGLSSDRVEEAKKRFLVGPQEPQEKQNSQTEEPPII